MEHKISFEDMILLPDYQNGSDSTIPFPFYLLVLNGLYASDRIKL
jgi:hypothetical protein